MRYIVRMADGFINNVFETEDHRKVIRTTPHKYDAWFTDRLVIARQIAMIVGGVAMEFDPINGNLERA